MGSAEARSTARESCEKFGPFLDLCVSSLRRGHANLLCIVPILSDVPEGTKLACFSLSSYTIRPQLYLCMWDGMSALFLSPPSSTHSRVMLSSFSHNPWSFATCFGPPGLPQSPSPPPPNLLMLQSARLVDPSTCPKIPYTCNTADTFSFQSVGVLCKPSRLPSTSLQQ